MFCDFMFELILFSELYYDSALMRNLAGKDYLQVIPVNKVLMRNSC